MEADDYASIARNMRTIREQSLQEPEYWRVWLGLLSYGVEVHIAEDSWHLTLPRRLPAVFVRHGDDPFYTNRNDILFKSPIRVSELTINGIGVFLGCAFGPPFVSGPLTKPLRIARGDCIVFELGKLSIDHAARQLGRDAALEEETYRQLPGFR